MRLEQWDSAPGWSRGGVHTLRGSGCGRVVRKAADPGVLERIGAFLGDNALTNSWRESIGSGVNWVERQAASDEDLRRVIGNAALHRHQGDGISDEDFALLERLKGEAIDREALVQKQAASGLPVDRYVGAAAQMYVKDVERARLQALAAELQGPRNQASQGGLWTAEVLGHPVAAYSAVTAGGALATAAGLEAYDWWMAQQQQAQKESQLPLS